MPTILDLSQGIESRNLVRGRHPGFNYLGVDQGTKLGL